MVRDSRELESGHCHTAPSSPRPVGAELPSVRLSAAIYSVRRRNRDQVPSKLFQACKQPAVLQQQRIPSSISESYRSQGRLIQSRDGGVQQEEHLYLQFAGVVVEGEQTSGSWRDKNPDTQCAGCKHDAREGLPSPFVREPPQRSATEPGRQGVMRLHHNFMTAKTNIAARMAETKINSRSPPISLIAAGLPTRETVLPRAVGP